MNTYAQIVEKNRPVRATLPVPMEAGRRGKAVVESLKGGNALLVVDGLACGIYASAAAARAAIPIYRRMGVAA